MKIIEEFRLEETAGEIGIEIEMEGENLPAAPAGWFSTEDHSLRGESREYVLKKPCNRDAVPIMLGKLAQKLAAPNVLPNPSNRCGTHVHINCQQMQQEEALRFIALYIILEDLMVKYCGEDREGNLFCLRVRDAESLVANLTGVAAKKHDFRHILNHNTRYSSINLAALKKFGSIEFRSLRTPKDVAEIATWVDMLLRIRDSALVDFRTIREMVEGISQQGEKAFLQAVMGDKAELLTCRNMNAILMAGVRRIQDLAYVDRVPDIIKYAKKVDGFNDYFEKVNKKKENERSEEGPALNRVGRFRIDPDPRPKRRSRWLREDLEREHGTPSLGNEGDEVNGMNMWWDGTMLNWTFVKPLPLTPKQAELVQQVKAANLAIIDEDDKRLRDWEARNAIREANRVQAQAGWVDAAQAAFDAAMPPMPQGGWAHAVNQPGAVFPPMPRPRFVKMKPKREEQQPEVDLDDIDDDMP